jgi:F420-dependent methylenetetrahydromethanopterin dehydrogenase
VYSTTLLTFYPQIDSLELLDIPNPLFSKDMEMSVKFCGDESYYARLFYKRSDGDDWDAQFFHLSGVEDLGENCRKFSITVDGDEIYESTGYVPVDFKVKVEAAVSPTYSRNLVNPDDLDADLLSDAWENQYFGSLDELASGDFDNDGETNYQEQLHKTDPTKPGIEGIIRTYYVGDYGVPGVLWAHVELQTGTLDLAGRTLTIMGNFVHSGGVLKINGGKLIVKGDYRIQRKNADGAYTNSFGQLNMSNEADHIQVEGDFIMDSYYRHDGTQSSAENALLTAGTLEVKGNFTQKSTHTSTSYPHFNFKTGGTHKVLLSGSGPQAVSFEDPSSSYSHFNTLEITNPDPTQITFLPGDPTTSDIVYSSSPLPLRDLSIGKVGLTLPIDINLTISEGKVFSLYGHTLNLNGHTLTINGDFIHSAGVLKVNGGKLIVKGDYRIQRKNADGTYTNSSGQLNMSNEADHIQVEGDFVMDSYYRHDGTQSSAANAVLTAGTLKVQGDFIQKSTHTSTSYPHFNFKTGGTHKVLLSGTGSQTVSFEDASSSYSHFNELLLITNTLKTFTTKVAVTKLFNHQRKPFILTNEPQSYFVDYDSDGVKDHQDSYPLDPNQSDFDQDNDGVPDNLDAFPYDPTESVDTDGDGIGNNADTDDDNDGVIDSKDPFPLDPNEWADTDNDGQGDNADTDDDNDGVTDNNDDDPMNPYLCEDIDADTCNDCAIGNDGFGPLTDYDPDNDGLDTDSNGICDLGDYDDDGDGILDDEDNCPLIANPDQEDENGYQDGDDIGDACEEQPKKSMMCFPVKAKNGNVGIICL